MIFLTIGTIALGLSMSVSNGTQYSNVQDSWLQNHIFTNGTTLTITNFNYNNALTSAGFTPISDYGSKIDSGLDFGINLNLHYTEGDATFDYSIERLKFNFTSDYGVSFFSINEIDDNLNTLVNYNVQVGKSLSPTTFAFTCTEPIYNKQYDHTYLRQVLSFYNQVVFNSIDIIALDSDVARGIGSGYYGSDDFNSGYSQGYKDGHTLGYSEGLTASENQGFQTGYTQGYADGVSDAMETGHITEIFSNIVQVGILPINVFLAMLNFEVFGINIGSFASGLLTIAIVIIVMRVIMGSSASGGGKE